MTHELLYLNGIYKEFKNRYGIELEEMEYGPGVFVEYFQKQKEWEVEAAFQKLRMCAQNMSFQGTLTLELGRSLTATCGYYVTTIQELKKNGNASYAIVDGGIHQMHYDGQIMGMKLPFYRQLPRKSCEGAYWNVCGALCTVNDVLAKNMWLNEVQRGDVIVLKNGSLFDYRGDGAVSQQGAAQNSCVQEDSRFDSIQTVTTDQLVSQTIFRRRNNRWTN